MEWRLRRKKQLREKENVVEIQHFSSRSGSPEGCLVMVGWHMLAFLCLQYNAIILRDREGEVLCTVVDQSNSSRSLYDVVVYYCNYIVQGYKIRTWHYTGVKGKLIAHIMTLISYGVV